MSTSSGRALFGGVEVFAAVVDAGSFVGAADLVGLTPPGVSRAIARLEARLKMRLFHRTTRAVTLTEEGRRFYEQVMPHLNGLEEVASMAAEGVTRIRGTLRVNVDPVVYRAILNAPLGRFMDAHPELDIAFIARDSIGDLVVDGFDLALRFGPAKTSSLIARKVRDTRW